MKNLLIIRGRPASGKTFWLNEHNLIISVISPDDIRLKLCKYTHSMEFAWRPDVTWAYVEAEVRHKMHDGDFIVLDAQDSDYEKWTELAKQYDYKVWYKEMDTPEDVCMTRNSLRGHDKGQLPDDVMLAAFKWLDEHPVPAEWEKLPDGIDPFKFFYIDRGEIK
jgi:predicted kinase